MRESKEFTVDFVLRLYLVGTLLFAGFGYAQERGEGIPASYSTANSYLNFHYGQMRASASTMKSILVAQQQVTKFHDAYRFCQSYHSFHVLLRMSRDLGLLYEFPGPSTKANVPLEASLAYAESLRAFQQRSEEVIRVSRYLCAENAEDILPENTRMRALKVLDDFFSEFDNVKKAGRDLLQSLN